VADQAVAAAERRVERGADADQPTGDGELERVRLRPQDSDRGDERAAGEAATAACRRPKTTLNSIFLRFLYESPEPFRILLNP
jgi:hypothetical protein